MSHRNKASGELAEWSGSGLQIRPPHRPFPSQNQRYRSDASCSRNGRFARNVPGKLFRGSSPVKGLEAPLASTGCARDARKMRKADERG